jgi:hypothetical protein
MMEPMSRLRLSGPPLALQIVGLLVGSLIVAQMVTLFLTMFCRRNRVRNMVWKPSPVRLWGMHPALAAAARFNVWCNRMRLRCPARAG